MKTRMTKMKFLVLAIILTCASAMEFRAQTTQFTYQGKLSDTSAPSPTNGTYEMQFKLFNAAQNGAQIGDAQTVPAVQVVNGIFTVQLDAENYFNGGADLYIEISVRPAGSSAALTTLAPRQQVTSAPYSIQSRSALTAVNSDKLGGVPASGYTLTTDARLSDDRNPLSGSGYYVQNQNSAAQPSTNFNISGSGTADVFNAATQFNIGGSRVLSVKGNANFFGGANAGTGNTSGNSNTFVGSFAGNVNTAGMNNSFFGTDSGRNNQADNNSFFGRSSGFDTTSGSSNSFFGLDAGRFNQAGSNGAFFGRLSGAKSNADNNSFFGFQSGGQTSTGGGNSFFGYNAGLANTIGTNNTIIGNGANVGANNLNFATAIGAGAVVSSSNTVVLGTASTTTEIPGMLKVSTLGATGNTTLCRNSLNQIATCAAGGGTVNSDDFVQNQNSVVQSADFNIGGSGRVGQFFSAAVVSSETFYRIGTQIVLNAPNATSFAVGQSSGFNATGEGNAFFGTQSGNANTNGAHNSFFGYQSGQVVNTANNNSFFGYQSGKITTGGGNAFFGSSAGSDNTTGSDNTFVGDNAGNGNGSGSENTIIGSGGFVAGSNNTSIGGGTTVVGSGNTVVGYQAYINGGAVNSTVIGAGATTNKSNTVVLGTTLTTVEAPNLLTAKNINVSSKVDALTVDAGLGIFDAIKLNNTPFGDKPLCIKTATKEIGVCPENFSSKTGERPSPVNAFSQQQTQIETQAAQIEAQQKQLRQQQLLIENLRKLVCATNSTADVCKEVK